MIISACSTPTTRKWVQGSDESGSMPASRTSPLPPTMRRTYSVILPCSCGNLRVLERSKRPLCCHFPFFGSLWMGLTEKRRTQSRAGSRNHDETPTAYHARMLSCYPCHFSCSFCRHVECSREAPSCFLDLFFLVGPFIAPFVLYQNTRETAPSETAHHQLSDPNIFLLRGQVFFSLLLRRR